MSISVLIAALISRHVRRILGTGLQGDAWLRQRRLAARQERDA